MKKTICLALLALLLVFANSCHEELETKSDLILKSGKLKKDVVTEMKSWFESNTDVNKYPLLSYADEIKWSSAEVMETDNSVVAEVQIKLKSKYLVMDKNNSSINVDQRLILVKKDGEINYSTEYLFTKQGKELVQDVTQASYLKKDGSFDGNIVLINSKGEKTEVYHSGGNGQEVKLKYVAMTTCWGLFEIYNDGSSRLLYIIYCDEGGGGGGGGSNGGGSGGTAPAPTPTPTALPAIELTTNFSQNTKTICVYDKLISTAARSFNPLATSFLVNFSDGVTIDPGDIKFDLGTLSGNNYGSCVPYNTDKFYVILNQNFISNRSGIEIAGTLIHEILHAQIGHKMRTCTSSFLNDFSQYISLVKGESYLDQHQLMMDNYLQPMIGFLKAYDSLSGSSADEKYYRGIALCGLNGLISLSQSEIDEINAAQDYFRNRGLNCQ